MRILLALGLLLPLPATAWEFSYNGFCELSHASPQAEVLITYDPGAPEYTLSIYLPNTAWPEGPPFEMIFVGPQAFSIGTTRQSLTLFNKGLVVRDRGFGNVLDGLEFNDTAIARSAGTSVTLSLEDAAPAVQAFRACLGDAAATS